MKVHRLFIVLAALALVSLACRALSGGGKNLPPLPSNNDAPSSSDVPVTPTEDAAVPADIPNDSEFPMTSDAYNVTNIGDGSLLYYTKMSLDDVMKFYRDEYTSKGYTERELLTVVSNGTFSMVFDGDPSGKAIVIQSVDLGDGSRTVAIRFEDV